MQNNLKNNVHWIFYVLGICTYTILILINKNYFPILIIGLIGLLYVWVLLSVLNKQYQTKHFIYTICFTGFLVSATLFFMHVLIQPINNFEFSTNANGYQPQREEFVPVVLNFHVFAKVLFLFFLFSIPIIIYK